MAHTLKSKPLQVSISSFEIELLKVKLRRAHSVLKNFTNVAKATKDVKACLDILEDLE